ncbi:MAG: DUF6928 family protein [Roseateles asaccharophilus]|uniref:Uncharacterized protein n=1 Tax=Roseateles asaccharophilus TaxID=582607 RepID=A0A4R6NBB8_9BURK|nr:hypothetical protein [Roseateles asaccharophilus]MDN3543030.1 hypothetical protein [Roseateles asaccharophilus]TDP13272.1 hypothetical protein DFR39_101747 [Roseateles asaccharophilus]
MGSKTCLLIQSQGDARQALATLPAPDEAATAGFVASLFPDTPFLRPGEADLSWTYVRDGLVLAGCSEGLRILVAAEVAIDEPSRLPPRFIAAQGRTILHSMNSVVDWLAFAVWEDGVLRRSLSVAPDGGVMEDLGERFAFELPYWQGAHPAGDPEEEAEEGGEPYPLPFHPLELGEVVLRELLGFQLEGAVDPALPVQQPERIRLLRFEPARPPAIALPASASEPTKPSTPKPWWKFW